MQSVQVEPATSPGADTHRLVQIAQNTQTMGHYLTPLFFPEHPGHEVECRILDMKYEVGEYCTLLYQLGRRMVIGTFRWGEAEGDLPASARLIEPLGMQVYSFEQDPALPGLPVALDPPRMRAALLDALPEYRDGARELVSVRARPLRYRPGKRCTMRFDIWERAGGAYARRTLYGKAYHQLGKAASVFNEMRMLAESEAVRSGRVVLAPVAAFLPELMIVLQGPVEGEPLELFLEGLQGSATAGDQRGWDGVIRSADALAAVHTSGVATDRERPIDKELKRFVKRASQAAAVDEAGGAKLLALANALPAWLGHLAPWGEQITLVHGDCKHSQCMLTEAGVAILDWDHCGMADPATDIGTYLATFRQMGLHQTLKSRGSPAAVARSQWLRALEDAFLDAYVAASGFGEGFYYRARWYEAVALMRKALRAFSRAPKSPMPLAQVEAGWNILHDLPPAA
ncbi:phosphotransferase family protein [Kouleothrix sp.]|uniref:phosphotransferase family protein n=1 Tax=Kouleothrix sp. TaxID=2779161 RepID=UPI00391CB2EB